DHLRLDARPQLDLLAAGQPRAKLLRLALREHEREPVRRMVRREVSPANLILVLSGPRRRLVRVVREEAGRAALLAGEAVHRGQVAVGENDAAADVPALVVPRR